MRTRTTTPPLASAQKHHDAERHRDSEKHDEDKQRQCDAPVRSVHNILTSPRGRRITPQLAQLASVYPACGSHAC
jgi:hypothetical protein